MPTVFDEFDADTPLGQRVDQATQVVKVARETVHAMDDDGIAFADKGDQSIQLGSLGILAGRFVREHPINRDLLKLAFRILIKTADSDITDALTFQNPLPRRSVKRTLRPLATNVNYFYIPPYSDACTTQCLTPG